jgi:hypothetical protein
MNAGLLHQLPIWLSGLLIIFVLLAALESGYHAGLSRRELWKGVDSSGGQHILTSMFALLGLILAFTYGAGVSRFDARKQAVVLEVNAIQNAFSLADVAAEPGRTQLKRALLDYARTRIPKPGQRFSQEQIQEVIQKSLQAQSKLRPITIQIIEQTSSGGSWRLIAAVNQVINAHTIRIAAKFDELPLAVILMLILVASASLSVAGFNAGISGRLNRLRMTTFAFVLMGVLLIILDFDQPVDGFIRVHHGSLTNIINEMEANLAQ